MLNTSYIRFPISYACFMLHRRAALDISHLPGACSINNPFSRAPGGNPGEPAEPFSSAFHHGRLRISCRYNEIKILVPDFP